MNTECQHCGHTFKIETRESLLSCPKCEQIFEPTAPVQKIPATPAEPTNESKAKFWAGIAVIAAGVFLTPFVVGIPIIICGVFVVKSASKS